MPAYNPYFFQTLGFTHISEAAQPETLLKLFGATIMVLVDTKKLWSHFQELIGKDPNCNSFVNTVRTCINRRRFNRRCVEALVLLLIRSDVIHVRRYADKHCAELDRLLRHDDRVYPQFVNDLRRGYVLVSRSDPQACSDWQANVEVEPSILVNVIIDNVPLTHLEQLDIHRASLTLGSLVVVLGTMLRVTPAYHMLALALTLLSKQRDVCRKDTSVLRNLLVHSSTYIAEELGVRVSRVADILAKEVKSLCLAIEVLKGLHETPLSLDTTLRKIRMHCGVSTEILDPILLLEDAMVLAIPSDIVEREVRACLSRCQHDREHS